jgi:uncharacterized protein (TIGR03437 family)
LFSVALALALIDAIPAGAQTATNLSIVSGNGQVTCPLCVSPQRNPRIQPYIVRVTDASGNPVANAEVDWFLSSITGGFAESLADTVTYTDANGISQNRAFEIGQAGISQTGYGQSTTTASLQSGASVTFYHTQSQTDAVNHTTAFVGAVQNFPTTSDPPLQGLAGTSGSTPIRVRVDAFSAGVPNVSIRLLQEEASPTASIQCATGPGADPGSVLTDANGEAACYPLFGGRGNSSYNVLIGGVTQDLIFGTNQPIAFRELSTFPFAVTAVTPASIQIVSGNNQSVTQGQNAQRLTAKIVDSTGTVGVGSQNVNWSVTPSGSVVLSNTSNSSDSSGMVSTDVRVTNSAVGKIQIKVSLAANSNVSTTFTITAVANVTLTNIQKVSGDAQTVAQNAAFPQPLVVQVNSTAGPAANIPINFSITGPGTLSAATATTDSAGQGRVNVQAGGTSGTITVTASASNLTAVTFTLTVIPPGPNLQSGRILNGADFQRDAISPCSVATIQASGLAPGLQGIVPGQGIVGPLQYTVFGDKVTINSIQAPIYSVSNVNGQEQVTVQIPCDIAPGSSIPMTVNVGGGSATTNISVLPAAPGIFGTVMSDGVSRAVIVRPDGSFVSLTNPARKGEMVRLYATGLGPVTPSVGTNSVPAPGVDSLVNGQLIVGVNSAGARVIGARLAPSVIGVYEVAFQVPNDAPAGNDVVLSLAVNLPGDSTTRFSAGNKIVIQ